MTKIKIAEVLWLDQRVTGDGTVVLTLAGLNTKGSRVEVEIGPTPSTYVAHIADECAQALVKVKDMAQRDIESVKQSLEN